MKTATFFAIVAGLVATSSAQLEGIPDCALSCAVTTLGETGCEISDIKCICEATSFIQGLIPCVQTSCQTDQLLQDTLVAAQELCALAGVTLTVQLPSATGSTSVPSSTEAPSTTETTPAPTETETETPAPTETETPIPTNNATETTGSETTPPAPTGTEDSSAARNAIALGGVVLAMAAALL